MYITPTLSIEQLVIKNNAAVIVDMKLDFVSSLGLIGASGSGKSLTIKALLGLLPSNLTSILKYNANFELNYHNIALVPQNPFTALSSNTKIKNQFFAPLQIQQESLLEVGLSEEILNRFPSELSGGQLQRILIALAIAKKPKLILFDEPTTALDTQNKNIILELIAKLQKKLSTLILFVGHDLSSVSKLCDSIALIKNGRIIEYGIANDILNNPKQEYTKQLVDSNLNNRGFRT